MANTCAYRAAANEAAAKAIRQHSSMAPIKYEIEPWESDAVTEEEREYWRKLFMVGHKAYRRVVQEEGRGND